MKTEGQGLLALAGGGLAAVLASGEACAIPAVRRAYRVLFWLVAAAAVVAAAFPHFL